MHGNKAKLEIFELGLIAMKMEIRNLRAWPNCGLNRLSNFRIALYHEINKSVETG